MGFSQALLIPYRGTLSSPLAIHPDLWLRPAADTCSTGGCRTFTASNKSCFVGTTRITTRTAGVDFWLECWIKPTDVTTAQYIFDDGAIGAKGFAVRTITNTLQLFLKDAVGQTAYTASDSSIPTANVWYHIVLAADRSGNATWYVNGVACGTNDISAKNANDISGDGSLFPTIGNLAGGGTYTSGSIAHFRYGEGYVPTTSDVTWLYNNKNPRTYAELDEQGGPLFTSLKRNYECNETDPTANLIDQHDLPGDGSNDLVKTHAELATNGAFTSDASWTKGTGWTIDAGDSNTAASDGTQAADADLEQACTVATGGVYATSIKVTRTAGNVCVVVGGTEGTDRAAAGTFTQNITVASTNNKIAVRADADFVGTVDDFSVKATSIAVGNGPSEAIASDSVGTNHATLTGFSAAQLISAWTTDISTSLNDGGYALILDGTDDYVACGNVGNVTSLDFYVKLLADDQEICTLANSTATAITVAAGTLTFGASLTATSVIIDGTNYTADLAAAGALLNDNAWHRVQITINSVAASAFNIGTDSSAYGNIVVDEWKLGTAHTWSFDDGPFGQPGDEDPILSCVSGDGDRYLLYQSTAASRPTYELLGVNSLPALDFDGTDYLYVASTTAARVALPTVLIVAAADDPTTAAVQVLLSLQDDASANNFLYFGIDTNGKFVVAGNDAGTTFSVTGDTVLDTAAHMLEATWDGTNWHLKVDGVAETETRSGTECGPTDIDNMDSTTVGACYTNGTSAGASLHFAGLIADITVKSNLSVGSLLKLERHYTTRYGL